MMTYDASTDKAKQDMQSLSFKLKDKRVNCSEQWSLLMPTTQAGIAFKQNEEKRNPSGNQGTVHQDERI